VSKSGDCSSSKLGLSLVASVLHQCVVSLASFIGNYLVYMTFIHYILI
jgi:hypothetical protein